MQAPEHVLSAETPRRLLDVLMAFERGLLAHGLDPREFRLEVDSAAAAKVLLRLIRDEIWPIELRDLTQADGSLVVGRLTIGMSTESGPAHAAHEPA
jgi:hypothetical protein